MAEPENETTTPLGLPIQPTGSGVADLEIMREQDAVLDGEVADDLSPTEAGPAADESEGQPS